MEAILGKDKILFARLLKDAAKEKAAKILFQTEHEITYTNSSDSIQTKDGAVATSSGVEISMSITALSTDDEINKKMREAVINGETVEFWEVNLKTMTPQGDCDALYLQGKVTEWADPANVSDASQFTTSVTVSGTPQEGKVKISKEQQEAIQYAFRDLEIKSE